MGENPIEIKKEEVVATFCEVTGTESTKFLEDAVETLVKVPHLFISTEFQTQPMGYNAFDMEDPYITYINILCIIYISKLVKNAIRDVIFDFKIISEALKVKPQKKPQNSKETISLIIDIYKELRKMDNPKSEAMLYKLVEKILSPK
jgi:hypothetical protein